MIFFDMEVYKYDWFLVAIDASARKETVIVNDKDKLEKYYSIHCEDIWSGFNVNHYDQYIFKGILCGFNPKKINDFIIIDGKPGWQFSDLFRKFKLYTFDIMQRIDRGLKVFEGFMGCDIRESDVPFDIDRKLTQDEIRRTIGYCRNDVEECMNVFVKRLEEFNTVMYFINHFDLPISDISKTKPQLAAKILGGNYKGASFDDEFGFEILPCIELKKYRHIADWYTRPENHDYSKHQSATVCGVPHTFAWGGGHGAIPKYHEKGIFLIVDVTAYYPSLQEKFHFGYRVMNNPENFEFIHNSNIKFKRSGDKKARQPFKIMDNAISGQMKQKTSALYDPMGNNSICINGQLLLLDLIEHLEPYCTLVNNNTDGVIIKLRDYEDFDRVDDIVYDWECRTGMKMDIDQFFGEIYQKDVNNYLIVDRETGDMKCKGAYLKKKSDLDYDMAIVQKALVEYMLHGTPVESTIFGCDDLKGFQMVKKIGMKYSRIEHGGSILNEQCVRCFASKNSADGGLIKFHAKTKRPAKVEGTPEHCFLWNGVVNGEKVPAKLDKQWYVEEANKRLKGFGVI